jgi:hypothetical protein
MIVMDGALLSSVYADLNISDLQCNPDGEFLDRCLEKPAVIYKGMGMRDKLLSNFFVLSYHE